jgi:hypothetical protein
LKARRRDLHSPIAEALSRRRRKERASPAAIAAHFTQAGDDKGAFLWWRKAAERSAKLALAKAAVEQFPQALQARCKDPSAGNIG